MTEQKHIRKYILWILFSFLVVQVHAQNKGYSTGYIINLEGDTIEGQVKDRSSGALLELYTRIRFKPYHAPVKRKLGPDEIRGYGKDGQHFVSMPLREESEFFKFRYYLDESNDGVFLKVISRNEGLTYYHWEYVDQERTYLDYIPLFHRTGSVEMVRVTQGILGLKRNRLMEYFRDCQELVQAIENNELNEIDEVYNFYIKHCTGQFQ